MLRSGFSPLTGFMHQADYESVVQDMRLKVRRMGTAGEGVGQQQGRNHNCGFMCFAGMLVVV